MRNYLLFRDYRDYPHEKTDFRTVPLCKFLLKVTTTERDIEKRRYRKRKGDGDGAEGEVGLDRGREARRGLNYGKRGRRRIVDGGKNASVEKNYPIMPKARRNYERWHT